MNKSSNDKLVKTKLTRRSRKKFPIGGPDGFTWNSNSESIPNFPLPSGNEEIAIVQNADLGTLFTSSVTVPVAAAQYFTLSQLNDSASWAACFDQYRIDRVELWLMPEVGVSSIDNGLVTSVVDYDDSTVLGSVAAAMDYSTAVTATGMCGHYRSFVPRFAEAAYSGAFTSYANVTGWLDCGSPAVQHYGVKTYATVQNQAVVYRAIARFHMRFRALR